MRHRSLTPHNNNNNQLPRHDSDVDFLIQSQACYQLHHGEKHFFFTIQRKTPKPRGFGV